MNATEPGRGHDPRPQESGAEHPLLAPGPTDLAQVAKSRLALRLAAPAFLLVLLGVVPLAADQTVPNAVLLAVRFGGWSLLSLAIWLSAPTPNGPLPSWLKAFYVLVCAGGAGRVAYHRFLFDPQWAAWEQGFVQLLWLAFLALPWILWRFCQHRGLMGRALLWLWCAMALLAVFAVNWSTRTSWALWLCPAIGLVLLANAHLTARDLWDDAVHKSARAGAGS